MKNELSDMPKTILVIVNWSLGFAIYLLQINYISKLPGNGIFD